MKREKISFYRSVTGKIFFVLLVTTILAAISTVSYVYVNTKNLVTEQALKDIETSTEILSNEVDTFLRGISEEVQLIASGHTPRHFLSDLYEFGTSEAHPLPSVVEDLTVAQFIHSGVDEVFIVNLDGIIVAASNENWILHDISEHEQNIFTKTVQGESYISDPHSEEVEKSMHMTFSAPVYEKSILESETGALLGVVVVHVPFSNIISILTSTELFPDGFNDSYRQQDVTLVTSDMNILYSSKEFFTKQEEEVVDIFHNNVLKLNQEELDKNRVTVIDNQVISCQHIQDVFNSDERSWIILLTSDTDSIFLPARTLAFKSSLIVIPIIITMLFIMILVMSYIVIRPIKSLIEGAQKITEGDLAHVVKKNTTDEFGSLASAFNSMLAKLRNIQKETEQQVKDRTKDLLDEKNKISYVTRNMQDGAILLNVQGDVLFYNESIERLFHEDSIDFNEYNLLHKLYSKFEGYDIEKQVNTCMIGKEGRLEEVKVAGKIYEIKFQCLVSEIETNEKVKGELIWIHDVTQAKLIEKSKDELISTASHQLRTPLTIARANLEMLLSGDYGRITKAQKKVIEIIEASTIRLISLVNDMLNLTKIEQNDFNLTFSKFSILIVIKAVIKNLEVEAKEKDIIVEVVGDKKGVNVYADKIMVNQVIQNILDNAIRYSNKEGVVEILLTIKNNAIEIKVTDSGIGIPKTEKDFMFNRFYRATNAKKIVNIGSGLGLHIAKKMVESMFGSIKLESKENVGTTVTILLPKKKNVE